MLFSIVVVCYNAGEKLNQTVTSILDQSFTDLEIVVKDGLSTDGSVEAMERLVESRGAKDLLCLIREKDSGIYDAMNEAVKNASGKYILFLNCGDLFYDEGVLERFAKAMEGETAPYVMYYGNRYLVPTKSVEYISPKITPLTCYRNVPCHQCCFYSSACFTERGYRTDLKVRADYELFLWLYFSRKAQFHYVNECVARYEGGGYSETPESIKRSAAEHREITRQYMTKWQLFYCKAYMFVTLQPLRHFLANNAFFSKIYNRVIRGIYKLLRRG